MSIAIVNNYQPHVGIGKYSFNLFERLREWKRDINMVYLESGDNPYPENEGIVKVKQRFNLPIFNKTLSWYYYFPRKIPEGFDLYHLTSGFLSKIAKYRKPCVLTHMDIAPLIFKEYPSHIGYFLRKSMRFYKEMDKIIAISEKSKRELVQLGIVPEEKVKAINLGYHEKFYKPISKEKCREKLNLPMDKKIIMNVGSGEDPRKNVPTILKALHLLKKEIPDTMFIRIGRKDPANNDLKNGLDIRLCSGIPENEMCLYYNSADIFAFPATYEGGIAYPPLEAMACGIPTIVTEELDVFRGGPIIIKDPYNSEYLAELMLKILTKPKIHKKLSKAALKKAKEFTLAKEVKETYKVYEEILS